MKITVSALRKIIKEELKHKTPEDEASYKKIMDLIHSVLGDTPKTKEIAGELEIAMSEPEEDRPQTISMKSIAQKKISSIVW